MSYTFGPQPAVDITTAMLVTQAGLVGTVHPTRADAEAGTNALTVVLAGEISTTSVPVSSFGQTVEFTHPDYPRVWWRSGVYISDLMSFDGIIESVEGAAADTAASAADAAATAAEVEALRAWINIGNTTRNVVTDPRATDTSRWAAAPGTGAVANETAVSGATDGPVLPDGSRATTYMRYTYTTAATAASNATFGTSRQAVDDLPTPILGGTSEAIAIYVRPSVELTFRARSDRYLAGVVTGGASMGPTTVCPAGVWTRVSGVITPSNDWDAQNVRANADALTIPNGTLVEVTAAFAEPGATAVPAHYDGDLAAGRLAGYRWSGTPNASVSEKIGMKFVRTVNSQDPDDNGNIVVSGGSGDGTTTWSTLSGKPATFPPSGHTHIVSELSDASSLGRSTLKALDPQAFRSLIGAGTGNGTSNLTLGSTSTTAAPGNHAHSQYVDSAQARTIADEQIALNGGTGGTGGVLPWVYRSGAYPALPATAPAGVQIVMAIGPLQPSVLPSWIGNGPTQVPATYEYNGGLS